MANPVISGTAPQWSVVGMGVDTLTVKPFNTGDLMVLGFWGNGGQATAVTGGGVSKWQCAASYYDTVGNAYLGMWWGTVTQPGQSLVRVTDPGLGTFYGKLWVREFTAIGANWSPVIQSPNAGTTGGTPAGSGTTVNYPSLSPSPGGNDLYIGLGWSYFGHMSPGSTSGFTYYNPASDGPEMVAYNASVSSTAAPAAITTDTGTRLTVAVIFTAGTGMVSAPAYAANYAIISSGAGNWTNPGNATGVPTGSYATWTSP